MLECPRVQNFPEFHIVSAGLTYYQEASLKQNLKILFFFVPHVSF